MLTIKKSRERMQQFTNIEFRFKAVATANHPLKNPNTRAVAEIKFAEVCEAYDVLSKSKTVT